MTYTTVSKSVTICGNEDRYLQRSYPLEHVPSWFENQPQRNCSAWGSTQDHTGPCRRSLSLTGLYNCASQLQGHILVAGKLRLNLLLASVRTINQPYRWLVTKVTQSRDRSDGASRVDARNQLSRNRAVENLVAGQPVFNAKRPTESLLQRLYSSVVGVVSFAHSLPQAAIPGLSHRISKNHVKTVSRVMFKSRSDSVTPLTPAISPKRLTQ